MVRFVNMAITLIPDVKICNWDGEGKPTINTKELDFNGDGSEGLDHESFNLYSRSGFNFCKTNAKPYDVLVKAVLMYAEELGMLTKKDSWSFDGKKTESEYIEGKILYLKTLMSLGIAAVDQCNEMEKLEFNLSLSV